MTIRNEKFNLSKEDVKKVLAYCQSDDFAEHDLLHECAYEARPDEICNSIVESILEGISYNIITCRHEIYLNEGDFYKHRKKCIAIFAERTEGWK